MNKKLLKSIVCIASSVGIASSIPFITTSCGCSSKDDVIPPNALPYEVYEINSDNVLIGFTEEFLANPSAYDMCDTMQIPARVISVADKAFTKKMLHQFHHSLQN